MTWRIRLDDEHGRFWLTGERRWSDTLDDGLVFAVEAEARATARKIQTRVEASLDPGHDWFPSIRVVAFRA